MKISRARKVHKTIAFFSTNFGFHQPLQILVDGTLCFNALKSKINLQDQIPKYFGAEVKLLTTPCVILETEKLGPALYGAMLIVKQFPVHRCGHDKNPISGSECLLSMLGRKNKSRYIVGTQDRDLQMAVRLVPGAPLIFLHHRAPTLEAPSPASLKAARKINDAKFEADQQPGEAVKEVKRRILGEEAEPEVRKPRRKKPAGPNPLSCKKKQKKHNEVAVGVKSSGEKVQKRVRKRIRVAPHVKEHLQALAKQASSQKSS